MRSPMPCGRLAAPQKSVARAASDGARDFSYRLDIRVVFHDIDYYRHANNVAYITWMETARIDYCKAAFDRPLGARTNVIMAAQAFTYESQLQHDDRLVMGLPLLANRAQVARAHLRVMARRRTLRLRHLRARRVRLRSERIDRSPRRMARTHRRLRANPTDLTSP